MSSNCWKLDFVRLLKGYLLCNIIKLTYLFYNQYQPKATCQCRAIDARSLKPIRSDFGLLKTLKIFRSNIEDQKTKLYRKLKANKVKTSLVKYTVLRASQYDGYIKKFIRLLQEKAKDRAI